MRFSFAIKLLTFFVLISCSNSIKYPSWYFDVKTDEKYYKSSGTGMTRESAVSNALNMIASQLQTTVSSNFQHEELLQDKNFHQNMRSLSSFVTENFKFKEYQVEKDYVLKNGDYVVLVSVDKGILYKNTIDDIENTIQKIRQNESLMNGMDIGRKIKMSIELKKDLDKVAYLSGIGQSINHSSLERYLSFANASRERNASIVLDTIFIIKSNDEMLSRTLAQEMNELGLSTLINGSAGLSSGKRNSIYLDAKIEKKYENLFGNFIVNANINISLKSDSNSSNFSKNHLISGSSVSSQDMADKNLYLKIKDKINTDGFSFLGM